MGFFDSVQEHGMLSVGIALILVSVNLLFSYYMTNRSLQIETITKARNENIEKIRTLVAENLQKSYKVKDCVYNIYHAKGNQLSKNTDKKSFYEAKSNYYTALYDYKYSYDLLMLYIKSIDPLMDTSKIEEIFENLMKNTTVSIKPIEEMKDLDLLNQSLKKYNETYNENTKLIKERAAEFIKNWLEQSYTEVLGRRKYSKLKNY